MFGWGWEDRRTSGLLLVVLVIVALVALQGFKVIDILSNLTEIAFLIAAPLLGIGFGLIFSKRGHKPTPPSTETAPIQMGSRIRLYSREELKKEFPLADVLRSAKVEVDMLGATNEIIGQHEDLIHSLIMDNGIRFNFVICQSRDLPFLKYAQTFFDSNDLGMRLSTARSSMDRIKRRLPDELKDRLHIWEYDNIPPCGMLAIDPFASNGRLQVELWRHGRDPASCHSMILNAKDDKILYDSYLQSYSFTFKKSHDAEVHLF